MNSRTARARSFILCAFAWGERLLIVNGPTSNIYAR